MELEERERSREVVQPPPVCALCWDWIWAGEAIALLSGDPVHMRCTKLSEAY